MNDRNNLSMIHQISPGFYFFRNGTQYLHIFVNLFGALLFGAVFLLAIWGNVLYANLFLLALFSTNLIFSLLHYLKVKKSNTSQNKNEELEIKSLLCLINLNESEKCSHETSFKLKKAPFNVSYLLLQLYLAGQIKNNRLFLITSNKLKRMKLNQAEQNLLDSINYNTKKI